MPSSKFLFLSSYEYPVSLLFQQFIPYSDSLSSILIAYPLFQQLSFIAYGKAFLPKELALLENTGGGEVEAPPEKESLRC